MYALINWKKLLVFRIQPKRWPKFGFRLKNLFRSNFKFFTLSKLNEHSHTQEQRMEKSGLVLSCPLQKHKVSRLNALVWTGYIRDKWLTLSFSSKKSGILMALMPWKAIDMDSKNSRIRFFRRRLTVRKLSENLKGD